MAEKPPVVCVVWEDAHADDSPWVENKDHGYTPKLFHSVGFLLYDGPDGVTMTSSWNDGLVACRDNIPRGMVHSVTYLQPVPSKRGRK